ncbi:MAG: ABC transporter ATP-binding protein/permease, partial [Lachnospiraceae bacterium]|nr:ABC transporter ATP-binding protein/permease [Lachnospiraceae bacterium]
MAKSTKTGKENVRPKISLWRILWTGIKIILPIAPGLWILTQCIGILHGVSQAIITFATQSFYDSVESVITRGEPLRVAIGMTLIFGGLMITKELLNGIHNYLHEVNSGKINPRITKLLHEKMARIDPICLEDTNVHDDLNKAFEGMWILIHMVNIGATIVTFYIPYFAFMALYLRHLNPKLFFAILLVFVPVFLEQLIKSTITAKFEDEAAPIRREYDYYREAITKREYFKETRILGGYGFFLNKIYQTMSRLAKAETKQARRTALLDLSTQLLSMIGYIIILIMLVSSLLSGEISIGAFAAVFGSIGMMFAIMREMVVQHIGHMAEGLGKAQNFVRFLNLPERGGKEVIPDLSSGIVAQNIIFTYPNAEHNSVDGVTLTIHPQETIAIVGENGAGKSTLVRLLLGLYKPTSGMVTFCGMDTASTNAKSLFRPTSGVFQKFQKYQMTLKENVKISDDTKGNKAADDSTKGKNHDGKNRIPQRNTNPLQRVDSDEMTNEIHSADQDDISTVLKKANIDEHSSSFPDGLDTMLSREFEGVDLSGGEWQRVAIARGLYRTHSVIALDEPTAAIDPLEESLVYQRFVEMSRDKMAIIVTHRLGSVRIADRVVVMDQGKIVGIGKHHELLKTCAFYQNMWNAQAQWYDTVSS